VSSPFDDRIAAAMAGFTQQRDAMVAARQVLEIVGPGTVGEAMVPGDQPGDLLAGLDGLWAPRAERP
jgi:hypothetical protein